MSYGYPGPERQPGGQAGGQPGGPADGQPADQRPGGQAGEQPGGPPADRAVEPPVGGFAAPGSEPGGAGPGGPPPGGPPSVPPQPQWQPPGAEWQAPAPEWQQPPPPPPPGYGYPGPGWGGPPPPPPRKSNTGLIVGLSIAGVVVLLLIAAGVVGVMAVNDATKDGGPLADASASAPAQSDEPYDEPNQDAGETPAAGEPSDEPSDASGPEGDVKITQCEVDSLTTWASAEITITNSTEQAASYVVSVEFVDSSGKRVGDALAATENLAAGQKAEETAQGLDTIKGKIDCKVTEVTRYEQ
jgi:hypothetical protein